MSDYCILQHRHHGCCPFVGGSRPERSKFMSELPRFTLLDYLTLTVDVLIQVANKVSKKRVNRTEDGNGAGNESTEKQPPKNHRHIDSKYNWLCFILIH